MIKAKLIVTALLLITLSGCSFFGSNHPKDERLIEDLRNNRAEFERLLAMFRADEKLYRVARDFTRPENAQAADVDGERLAEYRMLLGKLRLHGGIEGYAPKDVIWFHASTKGLGVSGSSKGYAYLERPPELLVRDLDHYERTKGGRSFSAYRHIEGNWYLYLDFED